MNSSRYVAIRSLAIASGIVLPITLYVIFGGWFLQHANFSLNLAEIVAEFILIGGSIAATNWWILRTNDEAHREKRYVNWPMTVILGFVLSTNIILFGDSALTHADRSQGVVLVLPAAAIALIASLFYFCFQGIQHLRNRTKAKRSESDLEDKPKRITPAIGDDGELFEDLPEEVPNQQVNSRQ